MLSQNTIKYFFPKVLNRFSVEKNRIWYYLPIERISHYGMKKPLSKVEFVNHLHKMLGGINSELISNTDEKYKAELIELADRTLAHNFDYLGSGLVHLEPIAWHNDFKSDYTWTRGIYYREYRRKKLSNNSDIKVPWELSRNHHLLWLGEAYLLTNDDKYAKEVVNIIEDWIKENPLMYSINWTCSMDVAIRAVNWMFAINMVSSAKCIDDSFIQKVYASLFEHGFFIFNNLEKIIPYSNNHYTSDIVGLLYIGQLFSHTRKGRRWFRFAKKEFYKDVRIQTLPSGVHYENSVSYHRLMTELDSYPLYMLRRIGECIPNDVINLVCKMYEYVANYTKPNGLSPLIADNDNGRFLPFTYGDFRDHRYLLDRNSIDNRMICCGDDYLFHKNHELKSCLYHDAGYAILRRGVAFLFVCNGGFGRKHSKNEAATGTHTHNDLLSFVLSIGEDDIIIDPGTYVYTPDPARRDEFRSTHKHNTVLVDGEEQNELSSSNVFCMKSNSCNRKLTLNSDGQNICTGSYQTIQGQLFHQRKFELSGHQLAISDLLEKKGDDHNVKMYFHFADTIQLSLNGNSIIAESEHYMVEISFDSVVKTSINEDTVSPSYGVLVKSETAEIEFDFDDKKEIHSTIQWTKKEIIK